MQPHQEGRLAQSADAKTITDAMHGVQQLRLRLRIDCITNDENMSANCGVAPWGIVTPDGALDLLSRNHTR